jgi:hypothetical protein
LLPGIGLFWNPGSGWFFPGKGSFLKPGADLEVITPAVPVRVAGAIPWPT